MSEGMRQGQEEHLGPRGSLWTALGSYGKLNLSASPLSWDTTPTNTSATARLIPLPKAPPEA